MSAHEESLREVWSRIHWLARALGWALVAVVALDVAAHLLAWAMR